MLIFSFRGACAAYIIIRLHCVQAVVHARFLERAVSSWAYESRFANFCEGLFARQSGDRWPKNGRSRESDSAIGAAQMFHGPSNTNGPASKTGCRAVRSRGRAERQARQPDSELPPRFHR